MFYHIKSRKSKQINIIFCYLIVLQLIKSFDNALMMRLTNDKVNQMTKWTNLLLLNWALYLLNPATKLHRLKSNRQTIKFCMLFKTLVVMLIFFFFFFFCSRSNRMYILDFLTEAYMPKVCIRLFHSFICFVTSALVVILFFYLSLKSVSIYYCLHRPQG